MKKKIVPMLLLVLLLLCGLFACDTYKESPMPSIQDDPDAEGYYQGETACSHEWNEGVHTAGNCKTLGYTIKQCTKCGETSSKIYDSSYGEHTFERLQNPTRYEGKNCSETGYTVVEKCKYCGETKKEYNNIQGKHNYDAGVYHAGDCSTCGYTVYTCKICKDSYVAWDAEKGDHVWETTVSYGKDCQTLGTVTRRCTVCGEEETEPSATYGAHSYKKTDGSTHTCTVCGKAENHITRYACSATGHTLCCTVCSYTASEESHDLVDGAVKLAGCTDDGYRLRKCKICAYVQTDVLKATDHDFSEQWTEDITATCQTTGQKSRHCKNCEAVQDVTVLPKLPHTYRFEIKQDGSNLVQKASCTHYAEYAQYCSVCGETGKETFFDEGGGLTDHEYIFTATETTHTEVCAVCHAEILTENHKFTVYADDKNYKTHHVSCETCGKTKQEEHTYQQAACRYCKSGNVSAVRQWDVSENGDGSIMAYELYEGGRYRLLVAGTGKMREYSLTDLPPYASYKNEIAEVIVENVSSVGSYAFYRFDALEEVRITSPVLYTFGKYAFADAYNLSVLSINVRSMPTLVANNNIFRNVGQNVGVAVSLTTDRVPDYFFYPASASERPSLRSLTISPTVLSVGAYAFCGQTEMTGNLALDDATEIRPYAFYQNESLTGIAVGTAVRSVGEYAFYGCKKASFLVGGTLTEVGKYAFCGCDGLLTVRLDVTLLPEHVFEGTSVLSVSLTNRLTEIAAYAFAETPLREIGSDFTGSSLSAIGEKAFYGCDIAYFPSLEKLTTVGKSAFENCARLTDFLSDALTTIGDAAFKNCSSLRNVSGKTLTVIPSEAFRFCTSLYGIELAEGLTEIQEYAFEQTSLVRITLPSTLVTIGEKAFYRCVRLAEIENNGALTLAAGTNRYGCVATNAIRIYTAKDGSSAIRQEDGQYILRLNDKDVLLGYDGELSVLTITTDKIAPYAFYQNQNLEAVTLKGTEEIGKYAFYGCRLASVSFDNVKTVADYAFASCCFFETEGIESVLSSAPTAFADTIIKAKPETHVYGVDNLTVTLTETLSGTFRADVSGSGACMDFDAEDEVPWAEYRDEITEVAFEETVTSIGAYAFYGCTALNALTFSGTSIGEYAFYRSGLTSVDVDCTGIGAYAFAECYDLQTLVLEENLVEIGAYAFADAINLSSVVYRAKNCTSFDTTCLVGCGRVRATDYLVDETVSVLPDGFLCPHTSRSEAPAVSTVTVKNGVKTIGSKALANASVLRLTLPASVETIAEDALAYASVEELTTPFVGGYTLPACLQKLTVTDQTVLKNITLRDTALQTLVLPSNLHTIGGEVFKNCTLLSSISVCDGTEGFPASLKAIGVSAFEGCSSLQDVTFSDGTGTLNLGEKAFAHCSTLKTVNLGTYQATLAASTFAGSYPVLQGGNLKTDTQIFEGKQGTAVFSANTLVTYIGTAACYEVPAVVDGKQIKIIGKGAFAEHEHIEIVRLSVHIEVIEEEAFAGCDALKTLSGQTSSMTTIGKKAFYGCTRLTNITLPDSVGSIGVAAFRNCVNLSSFVLPSSVTTLGEEVFASCKNLSAFSFNGCSIDTVPAEMFSECVKLLSLDLPASVLTIADGAFERCTLLERVTIPASKKDQTIGNKVFANCRSLEEVILPDSVASVGSDVFVGCGSLTRLTFGKKASILEKGILAGCTSLTELTLPSLHQQFSEIKDELTKDGNPVSRTYTYYYPLGYLFSTSPNYGTKTEQFILARYTDVGSSAQVEQYESVTYYVPSSLTKVVVNGGDVLYGAFYNCTSLQEVDISATGNKLGSKAFYGCKSLSTVLLPEGITEIGAYAFRFCTALNDFLLPETCTVVDKTAFQNTAFSSQNKNWRYYTLSEGTAFSSLKTYYYPTYTKADVAEGDIVYAKKYYVTSGSYSPVAYKTLHEGLTYYTVSKATYVKNLNAESFQKSIYYTLQDATFEVTYNRDLTSSTYPYFVDKAGDGTYTPTTDTVYQSGTTYYVLTKGSFVRAASYTSGTYYYACTFTESAEQKGAATAGTQYYVADYVLTFDTFADDKAYFVQEMKEVRLTESTFVAQTYYEWTDGKVLYLSIRTASDEIIYYAIDSRTDETGRIDVRDGTVYLANSVFANTKITYLSLPASLKKVGAGVLTGNNSLVQLSTPFVGSTQGSNQYLAYFFGGASVSDNATFLPESFVSLILTGSGTVAKQLCENSTFLETVVLRDGYTVISDSAFSGCTALTSITLSKNLTNIGTAAFQNTGLLSIEIPESVTVIKRGILSGCESLKLLVTPFVGYSMSESTFVGHMFGAASLSGSASVIPKSLSCIVLTGKNDNIPLSSFTGCSNVTTVVLNNNIVQVYEDFKNTSLESVIVCGVSSAEWNINGITENEKPDDAKKHFVYFNEDSLSLSTLQELQNDIVIESSGSEKITFLSAEYSSSDDTVVSVVDGKTNIVGTGKCVITAKVTVSDYRGETIFFYISYDVEITENR